VDPIVVRRVCKGLARVGRVRVRVCLESITSELGLRMRCAVRHAIVRVSRRASRDGIGQSGWPCSFVAAPRARPAPARILRSLCPQLLSRKTAWLPPHSRHSRAGPRPRRHAGPGRRGGRVRPPCVPRHCPASETACGTPADGRLNGCDGAVSVHSGVGRWPLLARIRRPRMPVSQLLVPTAGVAPAPRVSGGVRSSPAGQRLSPSPPCPDVQRP
jgi:hypothetical protein